ncbi:MAG: hypothetical protein HC927_12470 [Deltaproteobacteria bacterium]|nr:hypothetical protein [Deltaproteobacteria bacterium]
MSVSTTKTDIHVRAEMACEQGDYDLARRLYRELTEHDLDKDSLADWISAEKKSAYLHLKHLWETREDWFAGFLLATYVSKADAAQIYVKILEKDLEPPERWRVQSRRLDLTIQGGIGQSDLVENFLSGWRYLETLGPSGNSLRRAMAQSLCRADNSEALAFLNELSGHPEVPEQLRSLVEKKIAELNEYLGLTL